MQICSKKNIIDAKHLKHTTEIHEKGTDYRLKL